MTDVLVSRAEDFDDIAALLALAFHGDLDPDVQALERPIFEPDRSLLVRDGGRQSRTPPRSAAVSRSPARTCRPHVTMVAVAPTHRRRGLLTTLMHRQLREVRDAGRARSRCSGPARAASTPVRLRVGGPRYMLSVDTTGLRLPAPAPTEGRLRLDRPDAHRDELARLYERVRAGRPGWSRRDERWWSYVLADLKAHRGGATERRVLLHEAADGLDGYALYRTKDNSTAVGPQAEVQVGEVVAATPEAYTALWRLLLSVDLTRRLSFGIAALDEPLLRLVDEPRQLSPHLADALWVRVVDVPAALAARRYATDVDVVIEVTDELLKENTGRWRLVGGPAGRSARPPPHRPGWRVTYALGELYLGGANPYALAAAGRVRELIPGTLTALTPAFTSYRAPSPMEVF
ncbi:GNAT family N-acetyltransferase [Micromonospora sp. BRA006-A]|nr:GNAT family N-acetyltransferase [Micromonospora sp. BRA006-A]